MDIIRGVLQTDSDSPDRDPWCVLVGELQTGISPVLCEALAIIEDRCELTTQHGSTNWGTETVSAEKYVLVQRRVPTHSRAIRISEEVIIEYEDHAERTSVRTYVVAEVYEYVSRCIVSRKTISIEITYVQSGLITVG